MSFLGGKAVGSAGKALDRDEARRALVLLMHPTLATELRALPCGRSVVGTVDDIEGLVEQAAVWSGDGQKVYYLANPVPVGHEGAASNRHIVCRHLLLVDVDPVRADGHGKNCATGAEQEQARRVVLAILAWLASCGFPRPVLIDSGNGFHLLYRVDLPNDRIATATVKRLLRTLGERFDTAGAHVDRGVHRLAQLARLPGSWARKGAEKPGRPFRQARILQAPEVLEVLPFAMLVATAQPETKTAPEPEPVAQPRSARWKGRATADVEDAERYYRVALTKEIERLLAAAMHERNNTLNLAAFRMGQLVAGGGLDRDRVEEDLAAAARRIGLEEGEIGPTIKSGLEAGIASGPRQAPERNARGQHAGNGSTSSSAKFASSEVIIEWASDIEPVAVEWLWKGRIPLGKLTTFAGMTSVGKTFTLLDITARVSRGLDWPDSSGECCRPGKVLFISAEDTPDDTLVPRLIELGADLSKIAFLKSKYRTKFTIGDLPMLDHALKNMGEKVALICIDPPTAFVGKVDDHKNAELRGLLSPLSDWADLFRLAIVFITHFNKSTEKVQALQKVMGSVAWVNAVRAAHMFAKDTEDPTRRLFLPLKMNLCEEPKGLAYRIIKSGNLAKIEWLGEVDLTADEAVSHDKKPRKVVAAEWLAGLFKDRSEIPGKEVWQGAKEAGLSKNAVLEAKSELGIEPYKTGAGWMWPAPKKAPDQTRTDGQSQATGDRWEGL